MSTAIAVELSDDVFHSHVKYDTMAIGSIVNRNLEGNKKRRSGANPEAAHGGTYLLMTKTNISQHDEQCNRDPMYLIAQRVFDITRGISVEEHREYEEAVLSLENGGQILDYLGIHPPKSSLILHWTINPRDRAEGTQAFLAKIAQLRRYGGNDNNYLATLLNFVGVYTGCIDKWTPISWEALRTHTGLSNYQLRQKSVPKACELEMIEVRPGRRIKKNLQEPNEYRVMDPRKWG